MSSILIFLGILLAVGSLGTMGTLEQTAEAWYLRRIAPWALAGYLSGPAVVLLQRHLF